MSVQILMSTYNGAKYLKDQIDSILQQDYSDFQLLIRDDGSTDGTPRVLSTYADQNTIISYITEQNAGVVISFFELIKKADDSNEWFAFSDQDDVWLSCKISKALELMSGYDSSVPLLYCSNKIVTDEQLNPVSQEIKEYVRQPSFGNALVQNICTGCTCLFNRELLKLLRKQMPQYVIMHDWWLYLTASCFGIVVYDCNSYILYRQHEHNVWGAKRTYLELFKYRIGQLFCSRGLIYEQAKSFDACFHIDKEKRLLLELLIQSQHSLWKRFKLLINPYIYRQKKSDSLIYRFVQLIGTL